MDTTKKTFVFSMLIAIMATENSEAETLHRDMAREHGEEIFHAFRLESDYGANKDSSVASWDLEGWIGNDENKLWLKSEGEYRDGHRESTEFWALYSRNISTFWDLQAGIRHDDKPMPISYAVVGINGLAPYFFETESHLFISENGEVSARLKAGTDFLITQKWIIQPYLEANFSAQDVVSQEIGSGLTGGQMGLQIRYELTRKFAPYLDIHYDRKFGETSLLTKNRGEDSDEYVGAIGLRLMF